MVTGEGLRHCLVLAFVHVAEDVDHRRAADVDAELLQLAQDTGVAPATSLSQLAERGFFPMPR